MGFGSPGAGGGEEGVDVEQPSRTIRESQAKRDNDHSFFMAT
jgi:hypothetical protein